jgi:hypothetical protein
MRVALLKDNRTHSRSGHNLSAKVIAFIGWSLCFSCNNAGFSGNSGKKNQRQVTNQPLASEEKEMKVQCADEQNTAIRKLSSSGEMAIKFEGEFCSQGTQTDPTQSVILFVVDGSGSMALNDPQKGGSCGRLQAIQAIMDRFKGVNSDRVSMAFQIFGDLSETVSKPVPFNQAFDFVKPGIICRDDLKGTNYQSALFEARKSLEGQTGRKIVYFITDGLPSVSGTSVRDLRVPNIPATFSQNQIDAALGPIYQQGLDAGIRLRETSEVNFYALFLQPRNLGPQATTPIAEQPEDYLKKIVGDPSRFRLASSAQELAEKITELEDEGYLKLQASTASAVLEADGFKPKNLRVKSVIPTDNPRIWRFVLDNFELFSKPDSPTINTLTIKIENDKGNKIETVVKIEFFREK